MKLNLFCGTDHLHGYINIDIIDAFQPDLLHDLRKPLPFKLESIEEIRIVDGLEHLNYIDAERMMTHWISLLRSHGKILIRVPN
jgi:predicted SAM-dependent methyltransferase